MTIAVDNIDITKVLSEESDASGCYRDVYFINDDIVMKADITDGEDNKIEYNNYLTAAPYNNTLVVWNDTKFKVRFPELTMVGKYVFAERIYHPHLEECGSVDCHTYSGDPCSLPECNIISAVDGWSRHTLGLEDIHSFNFCWDAANETAWIIDFGC